MTTFGPSRWVTKRGGRDDVQAKMVLDVDLNCPPSSFEILELEESSSSLRPPVSRRISVSVNFQRIRSTVQQQGSAPLANNGLDSSVIDLEAIEDEVQMLPSSRGFPQARNHSRGNQRVTVVLDEDPDTNSRRSEGSVITLSLNDHSKHESTSTNAAVINCELYPGLEEEYNGKGKNVIVPTPEPPKEPTFNCPICMNKLVEPSSTICGHIFCQCCIKASIQAQKKCPTCRRKLTMNNFHRVYLPTTD